MIGRFAGSVSSQWAVEPFSTRRPASSGSSRSTGSSSRSLHSSTRIIAAAAVIGLVMDEMRKIVSRPIFPFPAADALPSAFMPIPST